MNKERKEIIRKQSVVLALRIIYYSDISISFTVINDIVPVNQKLKVQSPLYLDAVYKLFPKITMELEKIYTIYNGSFSSKDIDSKRIINDIYSFLINEKAYRYYNQDTDDKSVRSYIGFLPEFKVENDKITITAQYEDKEDFNKKTIIFKEQPEYNEKIHGEYLELYEDYLQQFENRTEENNHQKRITMTKNNR